jgi:hypothetical protein
MLPLAKRALSPEEVEQRREAAKARWAKFKTGAAVVAGTAALAPLAAMGGNRLLLHGVLNYMGAGGKKISTRGTSSMGVRDLWRARSSIPDHVRDIIRRPTAEGKTPTGKELRRQFARDSFWGRERMIVTGDKGKVLANAKGNALAVQLDPRQQKVFEDSIKTQDKLKTFHNHAVDTVPSPPDARLSMGLNLARRDAGKKPASNYVYSHGQTKGGKTRTRITRFDETPIGDKIAQDTGPVTPFSNQGTRHITEPQYNYSEEDWHQAAKSPKFLERKSDSFKPYKSSQYYRTKTVEKLQTGLPLAKALIV